MRNFSNVKRLTCIHFLFSQSEVTADEGSTIKTNVAKMAAPKRTANIAKTTSTGAEDSGAARIAAQNFMDLLEEYRDARLNELPNWDSLTSNEKDIFLKADVAVKKLTELVKAIVDRLVKKDTAALKETAKIRAANKLMVDLGLDLTKDAHLKPIKCVEKSAVNIFVYLSATSIELPEDYSIVIESQLKDLYDQLSLQISKIPKFN